jgi:hypothetical protein
MWADSDFAPLMYNTGTMYSKISDFLYWSESQCGQILTCALYCLQYIRMISDFLYRSESQCGQILTCALYCLQ